VQHDAFDTINDVLTKYIELGIISASLSISIASKTLMLWPCRLAHLCVCVQKVYCGKSADWIRMPFGVVRGVGRGMGVLDGVVIVEGKGQF